MGSNDTYRKTLLRACLVAGDEVALAKQLDVPVGTIVGWLLGDAAVPTEHFLKAVDIVSAANGRHVGEVKKFLEEMRVRYALKRRRGSNLDASRNSS
jgi:hypothetical protein